ncbi:hypothetical protein N0B44_01740 [Roseibacterium beibuensis]|uniref:Uncharacterized protein n=1 Tax=[Roseibacterium] beibuensis TaxID=1193142 RepID=A0ABP9KZN0_9RHOB|nr:hypothetical protein [Roseibacterium beibuensis]MCS6621625.1 hypothetical protein [Roseibacterium beibuensis]
MPSLTSLGLRYLVWLVGLRLVFAALVAFAGLPNSLAAGVILASVPAVDIGMRAARTADRLLSLKDWAAVWGVMIGPYLVLNVVVPAVLIPEVRQMLSEPQGLGDTFFLAASTGLMLALFLSIGKRAAGASAPGNGGNRTP